MRKRIDLSKLLHKLPVGILKSDSEGNLSAASPADFPAPTNVMPLPATATEGNIATFNSSKEVIDSSTKPADFAAASHTHDYAATTHNHDLDYADISHNHDLDYADISDAVPAVGTEGQVLTVVSGAKAWADPTGGGSTPSLVQAFSGAYVVTSADQVGIANGEHTKVNFDTSVFDEGSWWDSTDKVFVVPAGVEYIQVTSAVMVRNDGGNQWTYQLSIRKNGVIVTSSRVGASSAILEMFKPTVTALLSVVAGDEIDVAAYAWNNSGYTWKIVSSYQGLSFMSVYAVGQAIAVEYMQNQNGGTNVKFWQGTAAEYAAIATPDADTIYFVEETT